VTEGVGDNLHVDAGGEHQRGGAMAEVVQPYRWQAGGRDEPFEEVGDLAGVQPGPVLLCENQAGVHPRPAPLRSVGLLLLAVALQDPDGVVVQGHYTEAAVGLRLG
jgi:hypothetical protein